MADREIEWLYENLTDVLASSSFEDFCAGKGNMGELYATYRNVRAIYHTLKVHPKTKWPRPLEMPEILNFESLVKDCLFIPTAKAPQDYYFAGGDLCQNVMVGKQQQFMGLYIQPTGEVWEQSGGRECSSYELIYRTDGVLFLARLRGGIITSWLSLLPNDSMPKLKAQWNDERKRVEFPLEDGSIVYREEGAFVLQKPYLWVRKTASGETLATSNNPLSAATKPLV